MTPSEKCIVKALVAVAWADGTVKAPEQGLIDGLLWAFGASDADDTELREYATKKRTLDDDLQIDALSSADRALLLAHAALVTHADGKQTKAEEKVLAKLVEKLGIAEAEAKQIVATARERAQKLAQRV
ncbi:MAG: TerB family tellurite resistance protein [Polyangiaceae bacterium]|nr:TerB family tellurite resistance protein [Polyangiaceae bacterium]